MFITPTQAVKNYDVSKPTLYADMKKGKLSFKKDDRGKRKINVAELERIYQKKGDVANQNETLNNVKGETDLTSSENKKAADVEIKYLKEMLDQQKQQFESEIENLRDSLKLAQEGHNKATLLLENKHDGKEGDWQEAIKSLKDEIANNSSATQEEKEKLLTEKQDLEKSNRLILIVSGATALAVAVAAYSQGMIVLPF